MTMATRGKVQPMSATAPRSTAPPVEPHDPVRPTPAEPQPPVPAPPIPGPGPDPVPPGPVPQPEPTPMRVRVVDEATP